MLVHLFWGQIFLLLLGHDEVVLDVHRCVLLATFRHDIALLTSMVGLMLLLLLH